MYIYTLFIQHVKGSGTF